jgi:hypothetical protein
MHQPTLQIPRQLQVTSCSVTKTFYGFNYNDNVVENQYTTIPPDPSGAAGANRLVAVVNSMIEVRQKNGILTYRKSLQNFFAGIPQALQFTRFFDPKVGSPGQSWW